MSKVKILLVGSVKEHVPVLRKKLKALNASKAGPFDACLCVGPIHLGVDDVNGSGEAFPIPVYLQEVVVDSNAEEVVSSSSCSDQGIVSLGENKNLFHLRGSSDGNQLHFFEIKLDKNHPTNTTDPLIVASCPRHIRSSSIVGSDGQKSKLQQCDLLLSGDWPQGMEDILNVDTEPLSYDVAEVALECRPRYHICPSTMLYHASPPYRLPNSDHVGRFLALAPVTTEKKTPKTAKFIHALGLVPLKSNPLPTTAPSTLPCPYGETSITSNDKNSNNNSSSQSMGGAAALGVPKFAMRGDTNDAFSMFGNTNKRGRDNNRSGNSNNDNNSSLEPPEDPTISTLFLYGLHKDVTGELQSTRSPKVLTSFHKYGVTRVRHPPNVQTSTYCFLEFPSQKEAAKCLLDCHGRITIDSVNLTLKWASAPKQQNNNNKRQRRDEHHPHQHQFQQHFVTQAEAKDSTTLFFHPPKKTKRDNSDSNSNSKISNDDNKDTVEENVSNTTASIEKQNDIVGEDTNNAASTNENDAASIDRKNSLGTDEEDEMEVTPATATTTDKKDSVEVTNVATNNDVKEGVENSNDTPTTDKKDIVEDTNINTTTDKKDSEEDTNVVTNDKKEGDENITTTVTTKAVVATEVKEGSFAHSLQQYLQKVLEGALNEGVDEDERVTAETEPALKVGVRCKDQYGFLEFASHAAATMALAAVTKSTDGGSLMAEPEGAAKPSSSLVGTTLRWAKGTTHNTTANKSKGGEREERLKALGLKRQYYPADGRTKCWFCLSSSTCETHLITGVYDEWYAAMPKGPVHQGHILLVPVTHTREGAWTLNEEWVKLVEKVQHHASEVYDMDLFVFERSMETRGGYHTHIQCVPVPRDCTTRLHSVMLQHAKASGFDLRPIQSDLGVKAMIQKDDSYFYAEIRTRTNQQRFLYRRGADDENASSVPLQFAREVLASVLNNPKLAHWKACVVDQEQETKLASDFRTSFNESASTS